METDYIIILVIFIILTPAFIYMYPTWDKAQQLDSKFKKEK